MINILIDAHGHIGHFNNKWWGIEKLKEFCSSKVDRIFVSNLSIIAHGMEFATNELIDIILKDKSNFLYGLVWCNPYNEKWKKLILEAKTQLRERFIGVKIHPTLGKYNINEKGLLYPLFEFSEKNKIPIFTHCDDERSAALKFLSLLEKNPNTILIFYHGKHVEIDTILKKKDRFPNVHVEASFCHSSRIREIIDNFGPESIIFGTDAPFRHRSPYEIILKVYREVLNKREQELFFSENIQRILKL